MSLAAATKLQIEFPPNCPLGSQFCDYKTAIHYSPIYLLIVTAKRRRCLQRFKRASKEIYSHKFCPAYWSTQRLRLWQVGGIRLTIRNRKMAIQRSSRLNTANLGNRFWNTIRENWYLGFTSFGGPPVHFKIVSDPTTPGTILSCSQQPNPLLCWLSWVRAMAIHSQ